MTPAMCRLGILHARLALIIETANHQETSSEFSKALFLDLSDIARIQILAHSPLLRRLKNMGTMFNGRRRIGQFIAEEQVALLRFTMGLNID
jgi:Leucine-rich repeat (LRR) protein